MSDERDGPRGPKRPLGDGTAPIPGMGPGKAKRVRDPAGPPMEPPMRCVACGALFASDAALQQHTREGHEPNVP
ncbi:MAG: hypothetical protein QOC71_718 [Thermoplasmata archaeon]|nr:hypothetical protein [Thermoplasmata archaeon]